LGVEPPPQKHPPAFHRSWLGATIERRREQTPGALDERPSYTPRTSAPHTYLWACSWSRTGSRSASIHSASSRGGITPWTGENSTAAAFETSWGFATRARGNAGSAGA